MAKHDLDFIPPVMNAAGTLGFFPDLHSPMNWGQLGAFITNPISQEPRTPSHGMRFMDYPGGFLLHTGFPNPGFSQVLRRYARHWSRSPLPVIVHLLGRQANDVARMSRQLESVEGVGGLEVGVDKDASLDTMRELIEAARGELPVIVRIPIERSLELASAAIQAGGLAVSLAPPRGMIPISNGEFIQGRLYGPSILPMALRAVGELVKQGIPTIGAGGIYRREHYQAMLSSGAMAVQLDGVLWRAAGYEVWQ